MFTIAVGHIVGATSPETHTHTHTDRTIFITLTADMGGNYPFFTDGDFLDFLSISLIKGNNHSMPCKTATCDVNFFSLHSPGGLTE